MLPALHTWTLTAVAIATGAAMLWAFGRFSDQDRVRVAKRKVRAHLYAFRLFADEPALIFGAQKQLLIWNARYLGLMLRPAVVIVLPVAALLFQLDAVYGRRALEAGEAAIVTARTADGIDLRSVSPGLEGRGVAVETPAVRMPEEHQVMWRVRAGAVGGSVIALVRGDAVEKSVQVGSGLRFIQARRTAWWSKGAVQWIEVEYPGADINVFGFGVHWLVWFFIVSSATMLALRKRLGVVF